jgi:hypothetical protein
VSEDPLEPLNKSAPMNRPNSPLSTQHVTTRGFSASAIIIPMHGVYSLVHQKRKKGVHIYIYIYMYKMRCLFVVEWLTLRPPCRATPRWSARSTCYNMIPMHDTGIGRWLYRALTKKGGEMRCLLTVQTKKRMYAVLTLRPPCRATPRWSACSTCSAVPRGSTGSPGAAAAGGGGCPDTDGSADPEITRSGK